MPSTILTRAQQEVLELLGPISTALQFYLAGGTALALHLGHRKSADFDFFTENTFDPTLLAAKLPSERILQQTRGTLEIFVRDVKASFFEYHYPLLEPLVPHEHILLASIPDIAAMKLSAISSRGSRKDFVDLYVINQERFSLPECLTFHEKKFAMPKTDRYHLLRSLMYFSEADNEETPETTEPLRWDDVKRFFVQEVTKHQ